MVIVLFENEAFVPAGKPVGLPIPVAPVVLKVISGEMDVPIQRDGLDEAGVTVFAAVTVIDPVAVNAPQPPVSGIE